MRRLVGKFMTTNKTIKRKNMTILEQIDRASAESVLVARNALSADAGCHVGTEVTAVDEREDDDPFWLDEGMTLWAWPLPASSGSSSALMAWDWVASESGVVARRATAFCYSNIELRGPEGLPLEFPMQALMFSTVIHALPWQAEVQREIAKFRMRHA